MAAPGWVTVDLAWVTAAPGWVMATGAAATPLYGSAPGNYYYPYSNPIYLTSSAGLGYSSANVAPAAGAGNTVTYPGRYLGIDEEPVAEAGGRKGMKVAKVYPGTAAEKAGLQAGDVIHSINGYLTEQRGNLAWIIANAAKNNVLEINCTHGKRRPGAYGHGSAPLSPR